MLRAPPKPPVVWVSGDEVVDPEELRRILSGETLIRAPAKELYCTLDHTERGKAREEHEKANRHLYCRGVGTVRNELICQIGNSGLGRPTMA